MVVIRTWLRQSRETHYDLNAVVGCVDADCHDITKASASMLVCSSLQCLLYLFVARCRNLRARYTQRMRLGGIFEWALAPSNRELRATYNSFSVNWRGRFTAECCGHRFLIPSIPDSLFSLRRRRPKCISRSRPDKKRICMPAICNPSVGCREIDGTGTRIYRS